MSDTGESDDAAINFNNRRGRNKRKIIMKFEYEEDTSSGSDSEEDYIRVSTRTNVKRKRKSVVYSDDGSASDNEVNDVANKEPSTSSTASTSKAREEEAGCASDSSNDDTVEKCPICLLSFRNQEIASPATCDHIFCFLCIDEWAKNVSTCPIDRREFKSILVFDSYINKKVIREDQVNKVECNDKLEDDNVTFCEICHRSNREDVMLLCDGCNQGYHMDCLTPQLSEIPEGFWYCDNCFESEGEDVAEDINALYEDLREMGVPENQFRITELRQTRIPRTRQSERIRASIAARTRIRHSRSSQRTEESIPSTSSIQRARNVNNIQKKRKSRKRRKNRRRRTYVVEYDVNNFDEKFGIKTSKKYVKKRKSKRRCKKTAASSKRSDADVTSCVNEFGMTRSRFAIIPSRSLSLFGNPNDLEYFSDDDNTPAADGGGTAIQTAVRFRNIGPLHRRKGQLSIPEPAVPQAGSSDVLSSILDLQEMWYNTTRSNQLESVEIGEDGRLNFCKVAKPSSKGIGKDEKNQSNNNAGEVTQAPLYPRGNNPNFSNTNNNQGNRYNNQTDNYRNTSGGGSTSNFSNNNFRNSTGSVGFNFPFRRNENAGLLQFSLTGPNRNPNFRDRQRNQRNERRTVTPLFPDPNQFNIEPLNPPPAFHEINIGNISGGDNFSSNEANTDQSNNSAPVYGPRNIDFTTLPPPPPPPQTSTTSGSTETIPPLAPPPWNQNLFRLAGDYGDDDDDADCPNFSIYSAESLQVARSGENEKEATEENAKEQEDDFEDKQEDLVQLGDDDDIPDAIDNNKNDESLAYKPEVQDTYESESENRTDSMDMEVCNDGSDDEPKTPPLESLKNPDAPLVSIEDINIPSGEPKTASDSPKTPADSPETKVDTPKTPLGKSKTPSIQTTDLLSDKKNVADKDRKPNKKGVLELYDDSDWEDWNVDKNELMKKPVAEENKDTPTSDTNDLNMQKMIDQEEGSMEVEGEQERSYTPCLDENVTDPLEGLINPPPPETSEKDEGEIEGEVEADVSTAVIDGIETELISEEEDILNSGNAANGKKKTGKDGPANQAKRKATEQFKKIGKSTKRRNYRGEIERKPKRGRSRSRSNEKENKRYSRNVRKRTKRKEIERYDVRNVIGQPRTYKDRYGRDTSRPPRSRSVSRGRRKNVRSKSRSTSSKRKRQTSFSMSPSPISFTKSPRRRSFSPRRSRSRGSRSHRRSPIRRRSRSPLRLRSPSPARVNGRRFRKNRRESYSSSSSSKSRSLSRGFTPRKSPPQVITKTKRKRSKERKKKKVRKRVSSFSSSPQKRSARPGRVQVYRKKKRSVAKSPVVEREWSATPEQLLTQINDSSWTPPLTSQHDRNVRLVLRNRENAQNRKKKREKKRKEKRRDSKSKRERRRRRSEIRESPVAAPSKEVFASGDNILVSVSFNKDASGQNQQTTVVTLPPTREEVGLGRTPDRILRRQKKPVRSRRYRKVDTKPVAIIDLDRSPFQEIVQSPRDVIILTDSEHGEEDNQQLNNHNESREIQTLQQVDEDHQIENSENRQNIDRTENSQEESFESSLQQLGPKTPPEPPVINKFTISTKQKQLKRTTLLDEPEDLANESLDKEVQDIEMQSTNKIGPNTPPESGPCSPDAYDPFDPTKSPSATPSPTPAAEGSTPIDESESRPNDEPREARPTNQDINPVELVMALMSSKTAKQQELANLSGESQYNASTNVDHTEPADKQDDSIKAITVLSNVLITPGKQQQRSTNLTNITSPVQKTSQSVISKLPLPKTASNNRHNGGANAEEILDFDSPYSPGSNDFDDLFDPPNENITTLQQLSRTRKGGNKTNKSDLLDNLFGSSSPVRMANYSSINAKKRGKPYKKTSVKVAKMPGAEDIKILDELPSSAVELQVKDKFLRKLNRQERVVEEVKLVLKPHYNKKHVSKEEYKEILRRAVPKICHSRSGEINPKKIQNLIEAYVRKFRQRNKLGLLNTGQVSSAVKCAAYLKKL